MLKKFLSHLTGVAKGPSGVFKLFIASVLFQFSLLSLISITSGNSVQDIPLFEKVIASSHVWWGILGLYGAVSMVCEKYISGSKATLTLGYVASIVSFTVLATEFAMSNPIVHTGGILSVTSAVFLGGLLYGRVKRN